MIFKKNYCFNFTLTFDFCELMEIHVIQKEFIFVTVNFILDFIQKIEFVIINKLMCYFKHFFCYKKINQTLKKKKIKI